MGRCFQICVSASAVFVLTWSVSAKAQDTGKIKADAPPVTASGVDVTDIVVTARKRDENLKDVPIAISAIGSATLAASNASSLRDIGRIAPSVTATSFGAGSVSEVAFFIRGIGNVDHTITADPGVGVYVDGVYLGRSMGANLDIANIQRVEVLRGPQGTLFGRNTIGGAVNIITIAPGGEKTSRIDAQTGTRGRVNASFYGNFPISDTLAMSISGSIQHRNGIGDFPNLPAADIRVGEIFQGTGRVAILWTPSDATKITLASDGSYGRYGVAPSTSKIINPDGYAPLFYGLTQAQIASNDDNNTSDPDIPVNSARGYGTALTIEQRLSENVSAKLIGSYRYSRYKAGLDDDMSAIEFASFPETGFAKQASGEFQINGNFGPLNVIAGLYYFYEKGQTLQPNFTFFIPGNIYDLRQTTNSYAGYLHGDYEVTDRLTVGAGVRYTKDKKHGYMYVRDAVANFSADRSHSWDAPTWDGSISYKLNQALTSYVSVQRGYQSGGYPARVYVGTQESNQFLEYDPTYATNFELGLKGRPSAFLQFSADIFYTRYKDLALQFNQVGGNGSYLSLTKNAGRARTWGVEFDGVVTPVRNFDITTTVGYNNARLTRVDPSVLGFAAGDTPTYTPRWTLTVAPQYTVETAQGGLVTLRADYSYRSSMYGQNAAEIIVPGTSSNNEFTFIKGRDLVGFNVGYTFPDRSLKIGVYGTNIFNKRYDTGRLSQPAEGYVEIVRNNDLSEFGVKLSKTF